MEREDITWRGYSWPLCHVRSKSHPDRCRLCGGLMPIEEGAA